MPFFPFKSPTGGGGNFTDASWNGSIIENVYIGNNGEEIPYNGWSATDYINVSGVTKVYRSGPICTASYNAWYDENKRFISFFADHDNIDTVPANAKYVRYSNGTAWVVGKIFTEVI